MHIKHFFSDICGKFYDPAGSVHGTELIINSEKTLLLTRMSTYNMSTPVLEAGIKAGTSN